MDFIVESSCCSDTGVAVQCPRCDAVVGEWIKEAALLSEVIVVARAHEAMCLGEKETV